MVINELKVYYIEGYLAMSSQYETSQQIYNMITNNFLILLCSFWLLNYHVNAGFIGAACGKLDAVHHYSNGVGNDISAAAKTYQNGTPTKPAFRAEYANGNCNGNGNGLHY